ncbi:MAG: penicillin-binding transpeptidase domain-containing protein [Bacteroidota bacterium]
MFGKTSPETSNPTGPTQLAMGGRLLVLKLFFALFFVTVVVRLIDVQVIESGKYQALARKQYEQKFILPATRGNVYDRAGTVLASNTMYVSFAADPKIAGDNVREVAETFSRVFGKPKSVYAQKLLDPAKRFVWLERRVKPEVARRIEAAHLEGIVMMNEAKRLYHYDDLAGTLIGFTDVDNKGISGLELALDEDLRGQSGSMVMQKDGLGRVRPSADYPRIDPVNGHDVVLTLHLAYQAVVEEELKRGIAANKADGGLAVMMNPRTGEILAMSVVPGVNPNDFHTSDATIARNRVVTDLFEPGSVFKVVTASAAYERNLTSPGSRFFAENGTMRVMAGKRQVRLIRDTHEYGWLTFEEAIEFSSNIVMAKVSKLIGPEQLYREARDYGFGVLTCVDLPGEVRGRLKKPNEWSGTTLQTMAYGYEVGVTPMQIVNAYAAVANKGILMRPYVVSQVRDANGGVLHEQGPQVVRRVISEETAKLLTDAFEGTVEQGTAKEVRIAGTRIAGKTGTSRKLVDGRYSTTSYTASFVGYFPVEDPQIVCLVMMDNPRARGYYGGITSGPIFRAIAERVIRTSSKFSPATPAPQAGVEQDVVVPDVRMLQAGLAKKMLEGNELRSQIFGKGEIVVRQSPEPGKKIEKGDVVMLVLNDQSTPQHGGLAVPDLRGMSLRRAMNRLIIDEFDVKVQGSGVVTRQMPAPGQRVNVGARVYLVCEPRPASQATLY